MDAPHRRRLTQAVGSTPQELGAHYRREVERYAEVIRIGKVRVE